MIHLSKEVKRVDYSKRINWEDLTTDLRRIYQLTGTEELVAVEANDKGLIVHIKQSEDGKR